MTIREKSEQKEQIILSPNATLSANSKGRKRPEDKCPMRTDFQRDRDRILHSNSFRRLMHKTQVFLAPAGDHFRTRLTHSLEVSQVANTIARALDLNEDLTEAIALGHDLGHTPFGHTGEAVLNEMSPHGYHHSQQSVRVVDFLENNGSGLNLTFEVIDGIACHSSGKPAQTFEGQIVRYADKIAYMNHDIEDALRAGVIIEEDIPLEIRANLGRTKSQRLTAMITDLVENSATEIKMSEKGQYYYDTLRKFMFDAVYTNPSAKIEDEKAQSVVRGLYNYYLKYPQRLPEFYQGIQKADGEPHRGICDYISGMSDRFCVSVYEQVFIPKPWPIN